MTLEKYFNFLKDEKLIYNEWDYTGAFKSKKSEESYCIMMPPPHVTGS